MALVNPLGKEKKLKPLLLSPAEIAEEKKRAKELTVVQMTSRETADLIMMGIGGFTPPTVVPQFNVRTGGVIGSRVHLDVDYDTQREFDASNNIQGWYNRVAAPSVMRRSASPRLVAPHTKGTVNAHLSM